MEVNKQKKGPQSIEELAYAIKFDFDKYNRNKLTRFKSDLASKLLNKIHLSSFAGNSFEEISKVDENLSIKDNKKIVDNKLLEHNYQYKKYDGESFTKAYKSALEAYGKLDEKTGERIPYIKLFLSHYSYKKLEIKSQKLKEDYSKLERDLAKSEIMLFLNKLAQKLKKDKLPKNFSFNYKNSIDFIENLNLDEQEKLKAITIIKRIYKNNTIEHISGIIEENEKGDKKLYTGFSQKSCEYAENHNEVVDIFCSLVDKLYESIEDKDLKQYAQYYITMKIILKYKLKDNDNYIIDDYINKDLEFFYYEKFSNYKEDKYIKDIIAEYVGKASDTVRKKIDKVKKIIQNNLLKSASRCN